jgi:site-specific DNA-adenine methylase
MSALRYPGGKTRAIKILDTYLLSDITELYSPFFGGDLLNYLYKINIIFKYLQMTNLNHYSIIGIV